MAEILPTTVLAASAGMRQAEMALVRAEGAGPLNQPLEYWESLRAQVLSLGELTTRLVQRAWREQGTCPQHFQEVDPLVLGGYILPARMHRPNPNTEDAAAVHILGDRVIGGRFGVVTLQPGNTYEERILVALNCVLGFRENLPSTAVMERRLGWHPRLPLQSLAEIGRSLTGRKVMGFQNQGPRGSMLWVSPALHFQDLRQSSRNA